MSYLATEIEPKALSTLSQFERATEEAFERIARFNERGSSRITGIALPKIDTRSAAGIGETSRALDLARAQAARAAPAIRTVTNETNAMSTAFFRSAQALNVVQGPLGPLAGRLSSLGYIFRDLAGISLASVLSGGGAFALASVATGYQRVTDRLRPFYDTQVQTNAALRDVIRIAHDTRQALDPVAQLYNRLGQAGKEAGLGRDQSRLTETVAKAARLSGGDADTQAAGLTQFAQGFGSGTLGGDELKSIRENTFRLAKAIADGLGVPIAKLKELGAEGKLTPAVLSAALARSAATIDAEFAKIPLRVGAALTQAQNDLSIFVGRLDEASGATTGFAKSIQFLGNNVPNVLTGLAGLATLFAVRNLADPISKASAALGAFGRGAVRGDRISNARDLITARRGVGVAQTGVDTATNDVQASQRVVQSIDAEIAAIRAKTAAEIEESRVNRASAQSAVAAARERQIAAQAGVEIVTAANAQQAAADLAASRARVQVVRGEVAEIRALRAAAEQRVVAAQQTGANAAADPRLNRANKSRIVEQAARAEALAEAELANVNAAAAAATDRLTTAETALSIARTQATATSRGIAAETLAEQNAKNTLAAADTRLAEAEAALAAAVRAESAAIEQGNVAGFARLSLVERRIAAAAAATAATEARALAENALTVATTRGTVTQTAYAGAITFVARAQSIAFAAGSKLLGFLGGPLGIALTGATLGYTYLATRTDEATDAAGRFIAEQDALAAKLGTTTAQLMNQTEAARSLALALADAGIEQAKARKSAAGQSLGASLAEAQGRVNLLTSQGRADFSRLGQLSTRFSTGLNSGTNYAELDAIRKRNPGAFQSDPLSRLFGSDPSQLATKSVGFIQTDRELQRAVASRNQVAAQQGKPLAPAPSLIGGGTSHRTIEQLKAYAADAADGGTALAQATEKFNKTKSDLDAELTKRRKAGDYSFDDTYVQKLTAAKSALNAVGDGQRAAAAGARAHNKELAAQKRAIAEETAALKEARSRGDALATIDAKYDAAPSAADAANKAKATIDSFFTSVKDGKVTILDTVRILDQATGLLFDFDRKAADAKKKAIDAATLKPASDAVRDGERETETLRLTLAGRADEAAILQKKHELLDTISNLEGDNLATFNREIDALRGQQAEQRALNELVDQRNRLIDIQAKAYGSVQTAVRDAYRGLLDGKLSSLKDVGKNLFSSFKDQIADKFSILLFGGDAEQQARDAMQRTFQTSADYLTSSAGSLTSSASDVTTAAAALTSAADRLGAATGLGSAGVATSAVSPVADLAKAIPQLSVDLSKLLDDTGATIAGEIDSATQDIVVTANIPKLNVDIAELLKDSTLAGGDRKPSLPISIEDRYNDAGAKFATKLFGPTSLFTKGFSKLGTFLSGAAYAPVGQGIAGLLGGKTSSLGATIGGGLGKALLGGTSGFLAKGLSAISSKLGSFAGPLGAIAGSVIGSLFGGLFKKTKTGSASITNANDTVTGTGSLGSQASADASSVQSALRRISDALGGVLGNFGVTIGKRGDYFRVGASANQDVTSRHPGGIIYDGKDEAAAIKTAIVNALQDGAVTGIREGTKRLLAAGDDLDAALNKALSFENVFRELKQYTDPVGAAIDDLNRQFTTLIDTFNQAGASADEFADLQKLYDLKRADAIKNATNGAIQTLKDFITNAKSGSDSPLSRQTVYANAKAQLDAFRADITGGKTVDADKLTDALSKFQDASQGLNGSRGEFYTDFNDILALAEQAQANQEAAISAGGTLPASPFDPATTAAIAQTAQNTSGLGEILQGGFADLIAALQSTSGGTNGSSFGFLPSNAGGLSGRAVSQ